MRPRPISSAKNSRPLRPLTSGVVVWTGALAIAALGLAMSCHAQPRGEAGAKAAATTSSASSPKGAPATSAAAATKPLWSELGTSQQKALHPLEPHWNTLNVSQKRKWIALSRNYANMSADEQANLHSRMIEWAALSNQQRTQARLNFAEVKRIPADERKTKWEQYQALSEEEKKKLAESAPGKPRGAAVPVRPVATQRLVTIPALAGSGHTPRILLAPAPAGTMPASLPVSVPGTTPAVDRTSATPAAAIVPVSPMVAPAPPPAPATYSSPPVPAEAQVPPPEPSRAPAP